MCFPCFVAQESRFVNRTLYLVCQRVLVVVIQRYIWYGPCLVNNVVLHTASQRVHQVSLDRSHTYCSSTVPILRSRPMYLGITVCVCA